MEQQNIEQIARQVMGRIFVELEASARHVHLTQAQAKLLFPAYLWSTMSIC